MDDYITDFYDEDGNLVDVDTVINDKDTNYTAFHHKSRIVDKKIKIVKDGKRKISVKVRQKQMVYFSFKYKMKQKYERDRMVEKARDIIKSPSSYLSKPPIIFNNVVLPEPEGPRIETNSLSLKDNETSFNAVCIKSPVL